MRKSNVKDAQERRRSKGLLRERTMVELGGEVVTAVVDSHHLLSGAHLLQEKRLVGGRD